MAHQFTLTQHVNQSPDAVFYAFTNSPMLTEWWCDWAFLTPYRGRTLYMYWDTGFQAMGQYREVEPPERLAFTWIDGASPAFNAAVTFTEADGGTRVELAYQASITKISSSSLKPTGGRVCWMKTFVRSNRGVCMTRLFKHG